MTHLRFSHRPVARYNRFFENGPDFPSSWSQHFPSVPKANVTETPQAYLLELNVPGRNKEDFKIKIDKDLLTVSFEKKDVKESDSNTVIRREFSFNSFTRSFTLDEKVDAASVAASYENGILKIELPKKEPVKPEALHIAVS